jgi:hypothetical protein
MYGFKTTSYLEKKKKKILLKIHSLNPKKNPKSYSGKRFPKPKKKTKLR